MGNLEQPQHPRRTIWGYLSQTRGREAIARSRRTTLTTLVLVSVVVGAGPSPAASPSNQADLVPGAIGCGASVQAVEGEEQFSAPDSARGLLRNIIRAYRSNALLGSNFYDKAALTRFSGARNITVSTDGTTSSVTVAAYRFSQFGSFSKTINDQQARVSYENLDLELQHICDGQLSETIALHFDIKDESIGFDDVASMMVGEGEYAILPIQTPSPHRVGNDQSSGVQYSGQAGSYTKLIRFFFTPSGTLSNVLVLIADEHHGH